MTATLVYIGKPRALGQAFAKAKKPVHTNPYPAFSKSAKEFDNGYWEGYLQEPQPIIVPDEVFPDAPGAA